jgi:hypothetical protein
VQDEFFPNLNLPEEVFLIEQDKPDEDYDRVKSRTISCSLKSILQYPERDLPMKTSS